MSTLADLVVQLGLDDSGLDTGLQKAGSKLDGLSSKFTKTGGVLTATVTMPLIALGTVAFTSAMNYDAALDTIQTKTGATGDKLTAFGDVARQVYRSIPTDMQTAADTVATLAVRTGQQGDALADLSRTEIELARITGTDLASNIDTTTKMFDLWHISAENQVGSLDQLLRASQATGVGVDTLSAAVTANAAVLQGMGFTYTESVALVASLESAGINTGAAMKGLQGALKTMADEGVTDAHQALTILMDSIKNAPTDMIGTQLAIDAFGAKAGPQLAKAIRDGTLSIDDLTNTIANGQTTILGTAAATNDFGEKLQIVKNRAMDALLPLGLLLFNALNASMPMVEKAAGFIGTLATKIQSLPAPAQQVIAGIAGIALVVGPLLMVIGMLLPMLGAIGTVLGLIFSPIGLVVLAILGLYIAYQTNFLGFADGVNAGCRMVANAFNAMMGPMTTAVNFLKTAFTAATPTLLAAFEVIKSGVMGMVNGIMTILNGLVQIVRGVMQIIKGIFTGDWGLIKEGISNVTSGIVKVISGFLQIALSYITMSLGMWKIIFFMVWNGIKTVVSDAISGILSLLAGLAVDAFNAMWDVGTNIGAGIIGGINAMWDQVMNFASSLANSVKDKISSALHVWSPSRDMIYVGEMTGEGLVVGMENSERSVQDAATNLGNAAMVGQPNTSYGNFTFNINGNGDPEQVGRATWSEFARQLGLMPT